jgi:hypothetical protein
MFSRNQQAKPPDPHRVSHWYLLSVATLMMSALFVMSGTAQILPRDALPPLLKLTTMISSGFIYILLVALVLNRFGIRLISSIPLTPFQACWVTLYFIGLLMLLELVLG